jgi:hypothetical protein
MAPVSALLWALYALVSVARANRAAANYRLTYFEEPSPWAAWLSVLICLVAAVFSIFFWLGMAELIRLWLDVERNTRQAASRLSKARSDTPLAMDEWVDEP